MANLTRVELVTPERILYQGDAESVTLRADGGDTTFLANHADYIASVDICVVRIAAAESTGSGVPPAEAPDPSGAAPAGESALLDEVRVAVHGGFVEVADNKVTIVAGVAELASEIDVARAERALEAAEARVAEAGGGAPAGEAPTEDAEASEAEAALQRVRVRLDAAGALSSAGA